MSKTAAQLDLATALREHLQSLSDMGLTHLPKADGTGTAQWLETLGRLVPSESSRSAPASTAGTSTDLGPAAPASGSPNPASPSSAPASNARKTSKNTPTIAENSAPYGIDLTPEQRRSEMTILQEQVGSCTHCPELCANRTQTVFGVGSLSPRLVFVGEGPGADEDKQGEPFVGKAGQLLTKIIGAMKLSREEVYILNTVKCRPPGNRNPSETELGNCWGYATRQLEILQPEFICCLGSIAARTLLRTQQSIGRMRGKFYDYRGSRVVVTYHPAYLLRTPTAKVQVWDDMKMLMAEMGINL